MGRSHPGTRSPDKPSSPTSSGITEHIPGISGHFRTRDGHRVPYRPSPDHVRSGPSRAVWPAAGSRAIRLVVCGIARRRTWRRGRSSRAVSPLAGSRAVRSVAQARLVMSLPVSATSESLPWPRSGERNARRRPCLGPTWRCSRRRHRRYTNIYSFIWPPRFIVARSAARLSAIVGPLASRKAVAGRSRQRDIIGHIRAYPGIFRTYSEHIMIVACERSRCRIVCRKVCRVRKEPVPDRVPEGRSRAVSPVARSRAVWPVV